MDRILVLSREMENKSGSLTMEAMSISLGRNDPHQIPAIFSTAVFSAIVIVSLYTFMGIVYMDELIQFLGGSQVNTALVKRYLQPIVVCNFTFVFVYMLTPFVRNDGAPVTAMWSTIIGGIMGINISMGAYFQSMELGQISFRVSVLRGIILILIGLMTLPQLFSVTGIWITVPCAEFITLLYVVYAEKSRGLIKGKQSALCETSL